MSQIDRTYGKQKISRRAFVGTLAAVPLAVADQGWIELFDGHSLSGWKPSENKDSWSVVDGMLTANGGRSHLFYDGPVMGADFRNFELEVELITQPECNSGVFFHTAFQQTGFPEKGFEVQVNNTARGEGSYLERKKTGSLYGIRNMYMQLVPDQKPFRYNIAVHGKNVQIRLNSQLVVDYVEPSPAFVPAEAPKGRFLDHGTLALQCHNNGSRAAFRSVRVRPLADNLPAYTASEPTPLVDETFRQIMNLGMHNVPTVDYHAFLRDGMTLEQLLRKSRRDGLQYGVTALASQVGGEKAVQNWVRQYAGRPVFCALEADGPDWMKQVSRKSALLFDYVVADSRKWIPQSAAVNDRQSFMDDLLSETIRRLDTEPIDLYSGATYLSRAMEAQRDQLWDEERTGKLIEALVRNKVAVEINTVNELPGKAFVKSAKQADCKFGFGSANERAEQLKRCEYGLRLAEECKLDWKNFYAPGGLVSKSGVAARGGKFVVSGRRFRVCGSHGCLNHQSCPELVPAFEKRVADGIN